MPFKQYRKYITFIISASLIFALSSPAFAQESESTVNGVVVSSGNSNNNQTVTARYYDRNSCKMVDLSVPYSDSYFERDDAVFYQDLAQSSLGMTASAFRDGIDEDAYPDTNIQNFYTQAGFKNIQSYGYDTAPTENSFSCVIASKKIDDKTIVAFVGCGSGYLTEWISNFTVGTGYEHEGFSSSADLCQKRLSDYLDEYGISGDIRLWISGYSRAAAVGNLFTGHLMDSGLFTKIYAYFFATPNNTRTPVAYDNIFNIIGQNDPVPQVPLTSWGYGRNGRDLYTLSQESNSNYINAAMKANSVMHEVSGISFRNNPDLDWQLHVVFEYLGVIFPTVEDFVNTLQPQLISAYRNHSGQDLLVLLREALSSVQNLSLEQQSSVDALISYLDEVIYQYISGNEQQKNDGSWNSDVTLGCNIALEHVPATYISWLFSSDNPSEIYTDFTETKRLVIEGTFDLEVWDESGIVQSISSSNEEHSYVPGGVIRPEDAEFIYLYTTNHDGTAVINLPCDRDYSLKLQIAQDDMQSLFSDKYSYGDMANAVSDVIMFSVENGNSIVLKDFNAEDGIKIIQEDGSLIPFISQPISSDIESITTRESLMKSAHSVRDIVTISIFLLAAPLLLLMIALIVFLFDRKRRKLGLVITSCLGLISLVYASGIILLLRILPNNRTIPISLGTLAVIFAAITVIRIIHIHKSKCEQ